MNACSECQTPVLPGGACPACGRRPRPGASAAAALLGLVASPLFACQEMYGMALVSVPEWPAPTGPDLLVHPDPVDFGGVAVGGTAAVELQAENVSERILEVQGADFAAPEAPFLVATDAPLPAMLDPGQALGMTVTFAPTAGGPFSNPLHIETDGGEAEVPVEGVGTP